MKTVVPKLNEIERCWYLVDAEDQVLGRLAARIARIIRGKDKPIFTPHMDTGDFVVVVNDRGQRGPENLFPLQRLPWWRAF